MAVVKGNGFGHGYVEPSRAFLEAGADALAVTRLDEAIALRQAEITAPILLFAPIQPENVEDGGRAGPRHDRVGYLLAQSISAQAAKQEGQPECTSRSTPEWAGWELPRQRQSDWQGYQGLPGVRIAGVYTHLATAAELT